MVRCRDVSGDSPAAAISDRYRVIRELGRGGMGVVYLAHDQQRDMEVAIKLCTYPQLSPLHIKREFRVAAALRHPNLVEFYELACHKHSAYFTMEYIDGCPLRLYVSPSAAPRREDSDARSYITASAASTKTLPQTAPPPPRSVPDGRGAEAVIPSPEVDFDRVRSVIGQLAAGLACLHAGGVVHRDVKPSNALVTDDGTVKLLDFGLARDTDRLDPIDGEDHLVGTAAYLAPEYVEHLRVSSAIDLYALGVVGYELCTGSPPFGGTLYSIARMQRGIIIPPARARNPDVPADLDALLSALMSADPGRRPSASEVAQTLRATAEIAMPAPAPQPVVGRSSELGRLRQLFDDAASPRLILITGASGLGKSTLMARALQHLRPETTLLWRGFCHERERVPYRAFDAIVDDLADVLQANERLLDGLPFAAALARVFPALAESLAPFVVDASPAAKDLRVERERALVAMAELIARIGDGGRVGDKPGYRTVIAIENLHWADPESVELMTMLLHLDRPVTLIATCTTEPFRDDRGDHDRREDRDHGDLPPFIAELAYDHAATARIDLAAMSELELIEIAAAAAPALAAVEHHEIARNAAGNPSLADLLARDAEERARSPRSTAEPRRLSRLVAAERQVAAAVATAAGSATFDQLRFVTELPSRTVQSALRALEAARILRAMPSQSGESTYRYYHELLRGTGYAALSEAERRQLHARFAAWFEKAAGMRPSFQSLAEHWNLAGQRANAARWALAAADASLGRLAFGAAASWYSRAVEMSALAPEEASSLAKVIRRARIGYAEATYLRGDIAVAAQLFRELMILDDLAPEHWRRRLADAERVLAERAQ